MENLPQCKTMSLDERKAKIVNLVNLFKKGMKIHKSKEFNEAQTRKEFIDPLLKCLGWDIDNEQGKHPNRREVIVEDRQKQGDTIKHPDYTLRIGTQPVFYVEAKQPSVNLKEDSSPALQVRRYAYTAKMPISVLTDFEELAIYDARIKPSAKDGAGVARIRYYNFEDYAEKFEEIYNLIGYSAVDCGSLDNFLEDAKSIRGTASVDDDILKMIEQWRLDLAEDIALHNNEIDEYNLTSCVQKIIDRIIFLRICEDKEIEEHEELKKICNGKTDLYSSLKVLFDRANEKFNAGLFATDGFLDGLAIQDKTISKIINDLYYPNCQYEFSVLPVEILGSIYERFLGKTIKFRRKTQGGHSVDVEEKPEVQKAGGVYYTPDYVVRYIVAQTIGKKLEGKTPDEVSNMRFADPACGSGSFLVGAFQYLLDWHLEWYETPKNIAKAEKQERIYKDFYTKTYKLTVAEKKRILLNNIYGVDIDIQAVEVTKLSLFLKLLENEGKALKGGMADLFKGSEMEGTKILPDMRNNIRCGNSLIGKEWLERNLDFGLEEQRKVNPFDWKDAFPLVFDNGGFDCVIGNPPYIKEYTNREIFEPLHSHPCYQGKMDFWYFFGYIALEYTKEGGLIGFIAPNNWNTNAGAGVFRNHILENGKLIEYADFGSYMVFENASIQTMIYIMEHSNKNAEYKMRYSRFNKKDGSKDDAQEFLQKNGIENIFFTAIINKEELYNQNIHFIDSRINDVIAKIKNNGDFKFTKDEIATGIDVHQDFVNKDSFNILKGSVNIGDGIFNISQSEYNNLHLQENEKALVKPFYNSTQLGHYYGNPKNDLWVIYTDSRFKEKAAMKPYPNLKAHLDKFVKVITSDNKPYGLHRARNEDFFKGEKIVSLRKCVGRPCFTYTDFDCYVSQSYNVIKTSRADLKSLVCILNSKVVQFFLRYKGKMQGDNFQVDKEPLLSIPIRTPNDEQQAQFEKLCNEMLKAKKRLSTVLSNSDKKMMNDRCEALEKNINAIVYRLYGLNDEEIAVVEK